MSNQQQKEAEAKAKAEAEAKAKAEAEAKAKAEAEAAAAKGKSRFEGPKELSAVNIHGTEYKVTDGVIELESPTEQQIDQLVTFGFRAAK